MQKKNSFSSFVFNTFASYFEQQFIVLLGAIQRGKQRHRLLIFVWTIENE